MRPDRAAIAAPTLPPTQGHDAAECTNLGGMTSETPDLPEHVVAPLRRALRQAEPTVGREYPTLEPFTALLDAVRAFTEAACEHHVPPTVVLALLDAELRQVVSGAAYPRHFAELLQSLGQQCVDEIYPCRHTHR
jgi:hypothetical protein